MEPREVGDGNRPEACLPEATGEGDAEALEKGLLRRCILLGKVDAITGSHEQLKACLRMLRFFSVDAPCK